MDTTTDAYLMLSLAEGVGQNLVTALLDPRADPRLLLADPPSGLAPSVLRRVSDFDLPSRLGRLREAVRRSGLTVLTPVDREYPERMREAPLRPLAVYARGDTSIAGAARRSIAIVGSRTPTPYGVAAARDFATALSRAGFVIWSGLAFGIDAAAHEAALDCDGATVAVQAGGLDETQPPSHAHLARRIVASGSLLLSEAPPGLRPLRGHFPRRNRLIAQGAEAVLVIEAGERSGALHTAHFALDLGRSVFAVPGPYTSPRSRGCHRLIAEGATLALDPESLLRALAVDSALCGGSDSATLELGADELAVLRPLENGPRPFDFVLRESGLDRARFLDLVFELCDRGRIQRLPGDLLAGNQR
ncbi:MAG: DNA-processing protein DprA [Planctomycetota bacterium]